MLVLVLDWIKRERPASMGGRGTVEVGLDKILVARELARLVVSSARLDSARFNFVTS
jgi:hypothetical protein